MTWSWYHFYKMAHLGGVVLWIGPPLGAYWIHLRGFIRKDSPQEEFIERRIRASFVGVLTVEHAGLLLLLLGGLGMLYETDWAYLRQAWMVWKIIAFLVFVIPIEILDIYWGQIAVLRALKKYPGPGIGPELRAVFNRYDRFTFACIPLLVPLWIGFFYLAVFKGG